MNPTVIHIGKAGTVGVASVSAAVVHIRPNDAVFIRTPAKVVVEDNSTHSSNVQKSFNSSKSISGNFTGSNINSHNTHNNTFNINIPRWFKLYASRCKSRAKKVLSRKVILYINVSGNDGSFKSTPDNTFYNTS